MRSDLFVRATSRALVFVVVCFAATTAHADRRVALLIGNSHYSIGVLANPANDVSAMQSALVSAGFDIIEAKTDLGRNAMLDALKAFEDTVTGADIGVVFYSGHGIEMGGQNYLLPTDVRLASDRDVEDEAIRLDRVLRALDGASKLKLVLLDACREDPFKKQMKKIVTRGSLSRGLERTDATSDNMLIAYAAAPGQVAYDGEGRMSPFTAALAARLVTPGVDVVLALREVRDDVMKATDRRQKPYQTGSLGGGQIFLNKALPKPPKLTNEGSDPEAGVRADYAAAKAIGTPAAWDAFLAKYPEGLYASFAKAEREKLASLGAAPTKTMMDSEDVGRQCDELAASPYDTRKPKEFTGVLFEKIETGKAINVCRAAEKKYPNELRYSYNLSRAFVSGGRDVEAVLLVRRLSEKGYIAAVNNLGWMFSEGRGVSRDDGEAIKLFRKAADAGNADAMRNLGFMYGAGRGVPRDDDEAAKLYRKAADLGHAVAMSDLGVMYADGRIVARDDEVAKLFFRRAADAGSAVAMYNLGLMFASGVGVSRDDGEAVKLYRKAADLGNAVAMVDLGLMYAEGRGVSRDDGEAVKLYRKAGDAGNRDAMRILGFMYANGRGVQRNINEARRWYQSAADFGDENAKAALIRLK